jgi:hypothetical protein
MAKSIDGARTHGVFMDEISGWHEKPPATFTFTWADGTTSTTTGIASTAIHESLEARGGIDPEEAKRSIEEFSRRMREKLDPSVYEKLDRDGYFDTGAIPSRPTSATRTITGKFTADEGLTMFEEDGTVTFGLDPADPSHFTDTIAPLENLE